ncbi:bifunctional adenosylcobinamide kinase/adenosylcobinamide-phosphate guanylyltransferase [Lacimonas salitolerans]|uniref:Bifunctional adenosylcobalamin biosynthesis protein n=1 Tax=Lacimonas salitolerans TaxID=1323750 RepID=A0ABW4EFB8_9RHOB
MIGSLKDTPAPWPALTLVLGGAASGKSSFAEGLAEKCSASRLYLATAEPGDAEMETRIAAHRARRGAGWTTAEAALHTRDALSQARGVVLFDCATMWLSNHMLAGHDMTRETETLLDDLAACPVPVIIVSNELGLSVVPENALARRFRQAQGELNQRLAAQAGLVAFVAAGLPMVLKGRMP